jgi:hypothetical protein
MYHNVFFLIPSFLASATDRDSIRFLNLSESSLDEKLPVPLIRKLVRAAVKRNEARKKK